MDGAGSGGIESGQSVYIGRVRLIRLFLVIRVLCLHEKKLTQTTPHPPEPNAEKLAYYAEASRMSMEHSFMKFTHANYANCKLQIVTH